MITVSAMDVNDANDTAKWLPAVETIILLFYSNVYTAIQSRTQDCFMDILVGLE